MTSDWASSNAKSLLSAAAVRRSAHRVLALAREGALPDWQLDLQQLAPAVDFVARVIRERYPQLNPPPHARWRHFMLAGRDLWRDVAATRQWPDAAARARCAFDLVITSVLLDAGAGQHWRYVDAATGMTAARSEGLALASLRWFAEGGMSNDPRDPLRADAAALARIDAETLGKAFQVTESNPLAGLPGRALLLNRLGATVEARPDLFALADSPRPGGLYDALVARADRGTLPAAAILECLLDALGPIWQNRPTLDGVALGDCWPYPALRGGTPADGYVALHKLSQWLAYSLIEPLEAAGIAVRDIDGLTGLAEYRNGGLFVDMGVIVPGDPTAAATRTYEVSDPFVVGWRALTVALLDEIAPLVRARLGVPAAAFPLAKLLEGGTWAAGRILAGERRAGAAPPFTIRSDGTVF